MATPLQQTAARVSGLIGALLVAVSVAGLIARQSVGTAPVTVVAAKRTVPVAHSQKAPPAAVQQDTLAAAVVPVAVVPGAPTPLPAVVVQPSAEHYPLQVGRYWVYHYQEPGSEVVTEVERVIVRRESGVQGKELFIFDDGGVVYVEDGKVFEMSSSGGVNIIPVDASGAPPPVVYRSQGMQIEKSVGAVDTSLVVDGRRFDDCLEVVTRFRAIEGSGAEGTAPAGFVSYSSFYASGIGMVGRQNWPRDEQGSLAVTLADHGTRQL
jgi:hypothetical protein